MLFLPLYKQCILREVRFLWFSINIPLRSLLPFYLTSNSLAYVCYGARGCGSHHPLTTLVQLICSFFFPHTHVLSYAHMPMNPCVLVIVNRLWCYLVYASLVILYLLAIFSLIVSSLVDIRFWNLYFFTIYRCFVEDSGTLCNCFCDALLGYLYGLHITV